MTDSPPGEEFDGAGEVDDADEVDNVDGNETGSNALVIVGILLAVTVAIAGLLYKNKFNLFKKHKSKGLSQVGAITRPDNDDAELPGRNTWKTNSMAGTATSYGRSTATYRDTLPAENFWNKDFVREQSMQQPYSVELYDFTLNRTQLSSQNERDSQDLF